MDVTRTLPEMIKVHDPKGKVLEQRVQYDWRPKYCQTCCQLGHNCKEPKVMRNNIMGTKAEVKQRQEWRKVKVLDPKVDKIDAQGRFIEQIEEIEQEHVNKEVDEVQWQTVEGRSAIKKHTEAIRGEQVDIGNAFKALVDTAQKIVQISEAQEDRARSKGAEWGAWNVRGLNKLYKQKELNFFCKINKVVWIAIIEHRVKEGKAESVKQKILKNWRWVDNYEEAPGGRIWIAWDSQQVYFKMEKQNDQFILGNVTMIQQKVHIHICAVYGRNTVLERKRLWEKLKEEIIQIKQPCLVMGDFNTILRGDERYNGCPVQEMETKDFKQFMTDTKLVEVKTVGRQYTSTNNHVHSRIDRVLANAEWIQRWPNMEGVVMNPSFSDHCPLSIVLGSNNLDGGRPFRFINCLANLVEFNQVVKN
ncbi:PREDICTED: uncharacterized protein LOC109222186 [Nicotiana attenuata]|uniref:uncharacterized protein LOC109222186 n=1 Tax=Nicotiana attenuata TaxID=49451 RepID=UPI000904FEF2|nr:PREDICTED: uncharacterized protein LOC109222186 [Nicotiana attenuata]